MTRARDVAVAILAAATITWALSACGIPIEDEARALPSPAGGPQPSATPGPAETGPVAQTLFLVKSGTLVAVQRKVPAEPPVDELMASLLAGPTDAEKDTGITSALLGSKVVADVEVKGGTATVELSASLEGTGRSDDVLAFGQIVCTLAHRPDVVWVMFTRGGQRIEVPRGDGSITAEPVNAASYSQLISAR